MLRISEVVLENFGPFCEEQRLVLPAGDGVVIVYGPNGKGKTSLLNAIRWAFTGQVLDRAGRERPYDKLVNRKSVREGGEPRCRVRVLFTNDTAAYDLTRALHRRASGEWSSALVMLRDGEALNEAAALEELAEILPAQVQRFFLFDGELLNQYEALVHDDDKAGDVLRDAIEKILGVPVLVNAGRDTQEVASRANTEITEVAKKHERTREVATHLETLQNELVQHRNNISAERMARLRIQAEYQQLERELAEQAKKLELLERRNTLRDHLAAAELQLQKEQDEFAGALESAWRAALVEPLALLGATLASELEKVRGRRDAALVAGWLQRALTETPDEQCPVCLSALDSDAQEHLHERFDSRENLEEVEAEMRKIVERTEGAQQLPDPVERARLIELEKAYYKTRARITDTRSDIAELEERLLDTPEEELIDLQRRREGLALRIEAATKQLEAQEQALTEKVAREKTLMTQMDRIGGVEVDTQTRRRAQMANDLATLFSTAVQVYKDELRGRVEQAATRLFLAFREEPDFARLTINEQYGLRIVNHAGEVVEDRSAGYEHLVAFALIGALQDCSPISGPVIMDSPFGRLDPHHVANVMANLPLLASQVVLLVHGGEIDERESRNALAGKLLAEYELERVSSVHTQISRRGQK